SSCVKCVESRWEDSFALVDEAWLFSSLPLSRLVVSLTDFEAASLDLGIVSSSDLVGMMWLTLADWHQTVMCGR
ncbi:MAG: hypothetical protein EB006_14080, partial [Betaproteobacteria bacterium]|nr:hypothetical protein [Betaproteobacteria bacterium]